MDRVADFVAAQTWAVLGRRCTIVAFFKAKSKEDRDEI
jgi:hypothetical protein